MTDQEKEAFFKAEERLRVHGEQIENLNKEIKEVREDQRAIYRIATSVEVIAERVSSVEEKVDDTNKKVDAQMRAIQATDERISAAETAPLSQTAKNVNAVRVAIITGICTFLVTGFIEYFIHG